MLLYWKCLWRMWTVSNLAGLLLDYTCFQLWYNLNFYSSFFHFTIIPCAAIISFSSAFTYLFHILFILVPKPFDFNGFLHHLFIDGLVRSEDWDDYQNTFLFLSIIITSEQLTPISLSILTDMIQVIVTWIFSPTNSYRFFILKCWYIKVSPIRCQLVSVNMYKLGKTG